MRVPSSQEVEFRVHRIVETVQTGGHVEDDLVELKAEWPDDHDEAARRIAGHANAARGEPILWIIGLDEKKGVVGADRQDFASWWGRVESRFDQEISPSWCVRFLQHRRVVVSNPSPALQPRTTNTSST